MPQPVTNPQPNSIIHSIKWVILVLILSSSVFFITYIGVWFFSPIEFEWTNLLDILTITTLTFAINSGVTIEFILTDYRPNLKAFPIFVYVSFSLSFLISIISVLSSKYGINLYHKDSFFIFSMVILSYSLVYSIATKSILHKYNKKLIK